MLVKLLSTTSARPTPSSIKPGPLTELLPIEALLLWKVQGSTRTRVFHSSLTEPPLLLVKLLSTTSARPTPSSIKPGPPIELLSIEALLLWKVQDSTSTSATRSASREPAAGLHDVVKGAAIKAAAIKGAAIKGAAGKGAAGKGVAGKGVAVTTTYYLTHHSR